MTRFRGTPIEGATVLVTGANRGLGLAFVQQAKSMGAAKIYAGGVRNPDERPPSCDPPERTSSNST